MRALHDVRKAYSLSWEEAQMLWDDQYTILNDELIRLSTGRIVVVAHPSWSKVDTISSSTKEWEATKPGMVRASDTNTHKTVNELEMVSSLHPGLHVRDEWHETKSCGKECRSLCVRSDWWVTISLEIFTSQMTSTYGVLLQSNSWRYAIVFTLWNGYDFQFRPR